MVPPRKAGGLFCADDRLALCSVQRKRTIEQQAVSFLNYHL